MNLFSAAMHAISAATDGAPLAPLPMGPNIFTVLEERRAAQAAPEEQEQMEQALRYWHDTALDLERRLGRANDLAGRLGRHVGALRAKNGRLRKEIGQLVFEIQVRSEHALAFEEDMMELCRAADQRQAELEAARDGLAAQVRLLRAALLDACPDHEFLEATGQTIEDGTPLCYDQLIRRLVAADSLAERRKAAADAPVE